MIPRRSGEDPSVTEKPKEEAGSSETQKEKAKKAKKVKI